MLRWLAPGALALALLWAPRAQAQTDADKATARQLFFDARDAFDAGKHADAAELFRRSDAIYPAPTARLGMARALREGGQLVAAYEAYRSIVNTGTKEGDPAAFANAVSDAKGELAALQPRLPSLVVSVSCDCEPAVTVDGESIPAAALEVKRFVDPGTRRVEATAPGHRAATKEVTVAEGESLDVALTLEPDAAAPPPPAPSPATPAPEPPSPPKPVAEDGGSVLATTGIIVGSLGVASLVVAGITGGLYVSEAGTVDDECFDDPNGEGRLCNQDGVDAAGRGNTMALINTITLPLGVVALGAGLTLWLLASDDDEIALVPTLGPGQAGLVLTGGF